MQWKSLGQFALRVVRSVGVVFVLVLALLACCQSKIIYYPRKYGKSDVWYFTEKLRGQRLEVESASGNQVSYWLRPVRQEGPPNRLWLVCAGNATLALEFVDAVKGFGEAGDDFLFIDYPGYGECEGSPSPSSIRESILASVKAVAKRLNLSEAELQPRLRIFGHSLGAGCCLLAASALDIRKGVLLSPFTSTMDMAQHMLRFPAGFLLWHRYDNAARLTDLATRGGEFWIFHGTDDEVIPVRMGRELHGLAPDRIHFTELPGVGHNEIADLGHDVIAEAFKKARE